MAFKNANIARKNYYEALELAGYDDVIQTDIDNNSDKTHSISYAFNDDEVKEKCAYYAARHEEDLKNAGYSVDVVDDVAVTISWA